MTAVCLAAGLVFGIASGEFAKPPTAAPTQSPVPPTATLGAAAADTVTPGAQKSLLLIGVSDANAPATTLEAVWVISFQLGVPKYYVTAFPPSATFELASLPGPQTLSQIHAEDVRLQLDHNFLRDAIQSRFPAFTILASVTMDRTDLAALVGELGGLPMNNQMLNGPALLQAYDGWQANSDVERAHFQGDIMLRLFALMVERQWTAAHLVQVVTKIPRVNASPETMSALQFFASDAPPMEAERLVWHVYGPEMEAAATP